MPVSSIAQILLRIAALNWMITGLFQLVYFFASIGSFTDNMWISVLSSSVYLIFAVLVWFLAPRIALFCAGKNDQKFALGSVTEVQLMRVAVFALGFYFMLNSFADVFNWLHYFIVNKPEGNKVISNEQQDVIYDFTKPLLTFCTGLFLACFSKRVARKFEPTKKES